MKHYRRRYAIERIVSLGLRLQPEDLERIAAQWRRDRGEDTPGLRFGKAWEELQAEYHAPPPAWWRDRTIELLQLAVARGALFDAAHKVAEPFLRRLEDLETAMRKLVWSWSFGHRSTHPDAWPWGTLESGFYDVADGLLNLTRRKESAA